MSASGTVLSLPRPLVAWWERSSQRERVLVVIGALTVACALLFMLVWQPLTRDVARLQTEVARDRQALAVARGQLVELGKISTNQAAPAADLRTSTERVLDEQGLRGQLSALETRDGNLHATFAAIDFNALTRFLGALATQHGVRAVEATLTARVEPGTVRADLSLAR